MSVIPFIAWICTVVIGVIVYIGVAKRIEKSGLTRLGATGNIFTCDPKEDKDEAKTTDKKDGK